MEIYKGEKKKVKRYMNSKCKNKKNEANGGFEMNMNEDVNENINLF